MLFGCSTTIFREIRTDINEVSDAKLSDEAADRQETTCKHPALAKRIASAGRSFSFAQKRPVCVLDGPFPAGFSAPTRLV